MGPAQVLVDWVLAGFRFPVEPIDEDEREAHRAEVEALSRPHLILEARLARHLGTDLESPHISPMTPPPSRQDGDEDDRA